MPKPIPLLFLKSGIANRPGLSLRDTTDKAGHRTKRWMRTAEDAPKPKPAKTADPDPRDQRGAAHGYGTHDIRVGGRVKFKAGAHAGRGEITAVGKDGVTVKDAEGREHGIHHHELTHYAPARGEGQAKPQAPQADKKPEGKPAWEGRQEGETDKQYAKRVIDKGPSPTELPEDHGKYFETDGAQMVDIASLSSTKSDEENQQGGSNGPKRMWAAFHGVLGKRKPITVMPHATEEGKYEVVDGNGTLTSVKKYGWKQLPVNVVSREEGEHIKGDDKATDLAKAAADPAKYVELSKSARQPSADPDELYQKAEEGLQQLKKWLNMGKGVASQMGYVTMTKGPDKVTDEEWDKPGGMLFIAGLKARDGRAAEKVQKDYKGDWSQLCDIVRCTLAADNLNDLSDAIKTLESHGMKVAKQPKNKFLTPTGQGYRDMNFVVTLPNGMLAEVQFNVKDMLKAKNVAHHFYEETRSINGKYNEQGIGDPDHADFDKWSQEDLDAYNQANDKQVEIYTKAWVDHVKKHYGSDKAMVKSILLLWRLK